MTPTIREAVSFFRRDRGGLPPVARSGCRRLWQASHKLTRFFSSSALAASSAYGITWCTSVAGVLRPYRLQSWHRYPSRRSTAALFLSHRAESKNFFSSIPILYHIFPDTNGHPFSGNKKTADFHPPFPCSFFLLPRAKYRRTRLRAASSAIHPHLRPASRHVRPFM